MSMTRSGLTRQNVRHAASLLWQGRNPAARVYDSIGTEFFLALDEGWLNLGLWEGDGTDPSEAPRAVRRLVSTLAEPLPRGGVVLDVGNGLAAQDPLIAEVARPKRLVALNITESQLRAGRGRLAEANALPVNGDATRIPLRDQSVDGVISVEAAFHFPSRARFFSEAFRVLRPGGVLSMSDVPVTRLPRRPGELLAGLTQLRAWGLSTAAVATAGQIVDAVTTAGFREVSERLVGERVIAPALAFVRRRLDIGRDEAPMGMRLASRAMLSQVELLWRRGLLDYLLLTAIKPKSAD
ncbi:MAG: methyltransferase domain-containing protein [Actinobacteria bacterium]|nr:MAG: methyltransferase domain-containing protein [Actinomycetota bacterium]